MPEALLPSEPTPPPPPKKARPTARKIVMLLVAISFTAIPLLWLLRR